LLSNNVLIVRNTLDCFGENKGRAFAPMIDPIKAMLAEYQDLRFITVTTKGSRVKLPGDDKGDYFFRLIALAEKAIRKLFRLPRNFLYFEKYYWKRFLLHERISRVLCIEPSQSFLGVCKNLSIEVCEVQHGVIDLSPSSASHKDMTESDLYPDFFLSWDKRSGENVVVRSYWKSSLLIGCNMALYHYWSHRSSVKLVHSESVTETLTRRVNVLVTLHEGRGLSGTDYYSELNLEDAYLPKKVLEYMVGSSTQYNYIFRLHPASKYVSGEVQSIFKCLNSYGLVESLSELECVSEVPLYKQLEDTEVHVTLYSSSTIEAAYLGVPTILLDPLVNKGMVREKHFEQEISDGIALIADIDNLDSCFEKALRSKDSSGVSIEKRFKVCEQSLKKFLAIV